MKLLYLPINDDEFPMGTVRAFHDWLSGDHVSTFDFLDIQRRLGWSNERINTALLEVCDDYHPLVVHAQLQETGIITPETLRQIRNRGIFVSLWMGDCRSEVPHYTARTSAEANLVLISSVGQIPLYQQAAGNSNVRYWQIAVDWERDFNLEGPKPALPHGIACDVVFSGRNYGNRFQGGPEREAVVRAFARSDIDFRIVGSGFDGILGCLGEWPRKDQKWFYQAAKLSLGVNNFNHIERYYSERQLQAMASGTCHLCWRVPGLDQEFTDDVDCVMYDSPEDAVAKAKQLLADDERRGRIGAAGRERVLREHSWTKRIEQYAAILKDCGVELV